MIEYLNNPTREIETAVRKKNRIVKKITGPHDFTVSSSLSRNK